MQRPPRSLETLSIPHPTRILFGIQRMGRCTSALIFALVPMTLCSGRSHTSLNIPILVPFQAGQWIRKILFQSCSGIRPLATCHFISFSGDGMDGIGLLRRARFSQLEMMKRELDTRIATYRNNNTNPNELLLLLERDMLNVFVHLDSLRTTFTQMVFSITEFQRCYLEILGLLDYIEIYHPRKYGLTTASTVANCISVITNKPNVVQDCFNAGIPVWFCRPRQPGWFPHNVLNVVTPFEPYNFVCVDKPDPPSPVIYDGPLDVCEKHNALHRFTRSWLVFKDSFTHEPSSATQASTSRVSSSFRASTGRMAQRPHCKYISFRTCGLFFFSNSNFQASN